MSEKRNKYDAEFREGAVRIVEETGKPVTRIARDVILLVWHGFPGDLLNIIVGAASMLLGSCFAI